MTKHFIYILLLLCGSTLIKAQNNAIFSGGSKDGHDVGCYTQSSNLNTTLSKGGDGDGHSRDCYMQTSNLNLTLSKGGSGDGHSVDCYTQTSNLNMTLSAGGSGDGHSKDCYIQASNLNNIFSGGIGGDGMLNGCANEPLGCTLAINLGNDTTFCDGPTLTLDAGTFPGGAIYLWQNNSNAQTFVVDTSGVYYVNVTDTAGCNGIDTIVVTVTPMPVVNLGNDTAFCAGNNLVLNAGNGGATYLWQNTATPPFQNQTLTVNTTGVYFVIASYGSCSDTDSVVVTVNPIITTNLLDSIVCQGDSALIFGVYRNIAGTYRDTIVSSSNCDSILVQQLIVNPTYNNNLGTVNICAGDSALIFGNYQTIAGTYYDSTTTVNGCDSIVFQTLNIITTSGVNLGNDTAICAGTSLVLDAGLGGNAYLWQNTATPPFQNQTLIVTAAGQYFVQVTFGSCTSSDTINVTVNPVITTTLADSIVCQGDSSLIFGTYRSVGGTYRDTISASTGCDSILVQQLIVNPIFNNNLGTVSVCLGDSALIHGTYQTVAGTYYDSLTTINGCDSIVLQTLVVNPIHPVNLGADTTICANVNLVLDAGTGASSYQWQGNITLPYQNQTLAATTSGQYFVVATIGGCSTSDTINVTVNPIVTINLVDSIVCQGDSSLIFGNYQTIAGTYRDTISASTGCDSILVQQLIVNPKFNNNLGTINICSGDSALILGIYQTIAGTYYDSLTTINGCDSIVSQTLVVNPVHTINLGADTTICANVNLVLDAGTGASSYQWQGIATPPYQNQTLAVTNGGQYYVVATIGSCSTSDTINVTIDALNTLTLPSVKVCQGDSALIFGVYQTVAGTYQDTVSATVGCDTIVSQQLIFHNPYSLNLGNDTMICETDSIILDAGNNFSSFIWNTGDTTQIILVDGNTLTTGFHTYYVQAQDTNGCMSTDTIVIEVVICSGVEELTQFGFNLYPNPTKGEFTLKSENIILGVELYSIIGEKVMDRKLASKTAQFNISHLTKGIYVVKILHEERSTITRVILD